MHKRVRRSILSAMALAAWPLASFAGVSIGVSINVAPPPLPVYTQPPCPGVDYIWTPGYWAWADDDYYWVPGTWVLAPTPGLLWTPGYWGWSEGIYVWNAGYWAPHVGFYGGVAYGFGYTGVGFAGGYWHGNHYFYNRAVNNVTNIHVTNVYNRTVVNNITVNHVSYNGGAGGIAARPTPAELSVAHDRHVAFTPVQREHEHMAVGNRELRASVNGGRPSIAATERPTNFSGRGVVSAHAAGGPVHEPAAQARDVRVRDSHGPEAHTARTDRPSQAHGAATAERAPGHGAPPAERAQAHEGERPDVRVAHSDRPPGGRAVEHEPAARTAQHREVGSPHVSTPSHEAGPPHPSAGPREAGPREMERPPRGGAGPQGAGPHGPGPQHAARPEGQRGAQRPEGRGPQR
ncbi:MAG TPA: hypothetical protein VJQ47_18785 [Steroidobacteraceae bacterium]|nr:hypothetical protein [Steroidobacteraceae bacterium]